MSTLAKCIQLCLLVFLLTRFQGPSFSRTTCLVGIAWLSFFFFLGGRESYSLHIHATKETASVKWKAIRSRSCKLPSQLGKRQTPKFVESQHVKQNKPGTCQLFTNSKHSLSISTEQMDRCQNTVMAPKALESMLGSFPPNQLEQTPEICFMLSLHFVQSL